MNRFEYTDITLHVNEYVVAKDRNVRLYDGDQKVILSAKIYCKKKFIIVS